ncbi:LysM peptidoglycan-binding domain-containing protein, partial [Pseudomonas aeruginosa]|uniref:LysM peptidoglycan-binding domain-containing protein n=1 Tax=Pseudomonas aeruginosa TaxID=287 RepID=UPI0035B69795|nr:hypothetical protein [Pseudomonas aeruginosa]MBW6378065.1 hypothetical protein [Pseudomonas aeruginosa]
LGFSGTASVGDILDAALERLQAQPSPALPPFAEKVLAKLRRFYDCASDFESGGVDIGRHWLDLLTQLGLLNRVQRSPALWEISQQGEDLLGMPQPSPAQAEAERPEVAEVAFVLRNIGAMDAEDIDGDNVDLRFEDAEGRDTGCDVSIVEYAEKAADLFEQHDRIVGALRAVIAQLRQHKNDYMDSGQQTYRALQNEIRELERNLRNEENAHTTTIEQRDNAEHWADQLANAIAERFGVDIGEHSNLNCPWNEALVWMQQPPAQAQHSVPAYVSYTTRPAESLAGIALRQLKDESRWVEIRDINAHTFPDMQSHSYYPAGTVIKLPAAAPGKEVPQAWLDVQVERRRQVEAEGYHGFRDSHYINYELSKAARAYIEVSWHALSGGLPCKQPESWPWMAGFKWADGRTMLVKAGALILAEIERLDRAAAPGKEGL